MNKSTVNTRVKKLRAFFSQYDIDALLIQKDVNIAYLTGFPAEESWLFVTRKKLYYITDFRYILEAKKCLKGVVIKEYTKSAFHTLFEIAKQDKVKRLGFDENHLTVAQFKRLKKEAPKAVQLKTANGLVENLRIIKDSQEIKLTREALRVHHKALKQLKRLIKPGKTERDIYEHLEKFIKAHKVGFSFPPIVASGPNAALPHAKITDRKFQANDVVLVDMGIDVKGYKSDLTRMFFLGKISRSILEVKDFVQQAQH
ncbi:MAG: aminopeptidase P family protein, partial [Candidatus Omnitrophica bacterium]|nr:aminopeptidase P family protein [Candidatus Omnitrophota bacterium]